MSNTEKEALVRAKVAEEANRGLFAKNQELAAEAQHLKSERDRLKGKVQGMREGAAMKDRRILSLEQERASLGTRLFEAERRIAHLEQENRELYSKVQDRKR